MSDLITAARVLDELHERNMNLEEENGELTRQLINSRFWFRALFVGFVLLLAVGFLGFAATAYAASNPPIVRFCDMVAYGTTAGAGIWALVMLIFRH